MTTYKVPQKAILTKEQLDSFSDTQTHADIVKYINTLNAQVVGVKLTDDCPPSEVINSLLAILDKVESIAKDTPPVDNAASRFGNPAFRTFYDKLGEASLLIHQSIPGLPEDAIPELSVYFCESWGNRTRIDYGSGMELNFLCWLYCLEYLGVIKEEDHKALVIRVFWRYIGVMRILQSTYWLEPAGSHGVWGLDDYHFLPFLFGSAQLIGHKYIRPKSIHDKDVVDEYSKYYMYLACIQFINSIKTASLRWHSPMLDDISGVKTWDKVNSGMIKMYLAEVLGKLPVIQHFYFGSILPYQGLPPPTPTALEDGLSCGHDHSPATGGTGWGDCCGIPIPSVFGAAAEEAQKRSTGPLLGGAGIKPVPFD
ncbi:Serine/threonine-protein phosphatase 2A activator 2 [Tulasnella sp. 403]|nr:Serine/threonine-protein phosphatase 2A activator 2 [Tulasnella sp. 403]